MTRAYVISNPKASRAAAGSLTRAVAALRRGGLVVEVAQHGDSRRGSELAKAALADGAEMIVAHGGDGTMMEIAQVIAGTGVPLGILPGGTGNRLAENLGIRWSIAGATGVILKGRSRRIDLGRLETAERTAYFAVAAGCGFDAEVMHLTAASSKRAFGVGAYLATAIGLAMNMPRAKVRIVTDEEVHEGEAVSVLLANCGEILPTGRSLAPQVRPDDGILDVLVLDADGFPGATRIAWRLATGRAASGPGMTLLRARHVTVTTEPALPVQADGELSGTTPLVAEVLPGALTVLAPAEA
ncbi:MAG: diacylglycerol/lipid kinase family protein [Gemmatimonadales bacterium]